MYVYVYDEGKRNSYRNIGMIVVKTYHLFSFVNRISLPLMESIETRTSPRFHHKHSIATLPHVAHSHAAEYSSDSDSDSDATPLGDTFITR